MSGHDDPVDAVILAYLDRLEGVDQMEGAVPRPALDHLTAADRRASKRAWTVAEPA